MTVCTITPHANSQRRLGFLCAIGGAALMSLDPIFIRYASVSGADTAFLFGLFSAISMPILLKISDKRGIRNSVKDSGWVLLLAALLMVGSASGLVFSLKNTSVANTFIILSATPAIAAVFSWLMLKEMIDRSTIIAIIAVMTGIAVVVAGSFGSGSWFGDLQAVFSVICLSLMFTLLRKFQNVSRLGAVGLGGLLLATLMYYFASPSNYDTNTWLIMAAMGLFTAPLGRVASMVATRHITSAEVSMTLMLETVLAPLWALLFFNEIPANSSLFGGTIILTTIFIYTWVSMRDEQ